MNQSFRQVFVTNSPTILASGTTTDLALGQVGIFDGRTYQATTAPNYITNKSLVFGWGTPDLSGIAGGSGTEGILLSGIFNETEKSKEVKARFIKGWRGKKAQRGQTELVVVGNSGDVTDTDTLFIKPEETRVLYVKLSGTPVDRLYSTQGLIRQYRVTGPCANDCTDTCGNVADPRFIAEQLANQINTDNKVKGLVRASIIEQYIGTAPTVTTQNCYIFNLTVCDNGDATSLGIVQAQYPGDKIFRFARNGSYSTYATSLTTNTLPAAYTNAGLVLISDCPVCPSGYTQVSGLYATRISRQDAGNGGALTTLSTDYGITSPESAVRILYQYGQSTYITLTTNQITTGAVAGDIVEALGQTRNTCVLNTPTTTAWTAGPVQVQYARNYKLTVADSICGTNRLSDIQAAYPDLTVTLINASGNCVHSYQTTIFSQCVNVGCSADAAIYVAPQAFEGTDWVGAPVDPALPGGTNVLVGLKLESAWVDRLTNLCTYGWYPYNADGVHIQVSEFDPNYNGLPDTCEARWNVKGIREYKYPQGFGSYVREQEEKSMAEYLKDFTYNPLLREIEGFTFQAKKDAYYDQYVLEFNFGYPVGGWSNEYHDSYHLSFYFPEGQGKAFETAINSYIVTAGINLDPVVL